MNVWDLLGIEPLESRRDRIDAAYVEKARRAGPEELAALEAAYRSITYAEPPPLPREPVAAPAVPEAPPPPPRPAAEAPPPPRPEPRAAPPPRPPASPPAGPFPAPPRPKRPPGGGNPAVTFIAIIAMVFFLVLRSTKGCTRSAPELPGAPSIRRPALPRVEDYRRPDGTIDFDRYMEEVRRRR
jgi:hypothetical protein